LSPGEASANNKKAYVYALAANKYSALYDSFAYIAVFTAVLAILSLAAAPDQFPQTIRSGGAFDHGAASEPDCYGGQTASFSVAATGTAPLSYQWKKNGTAISGATSSNYTTPASTSSDNGAQFTASISNTAGV